ncbi:KAD5 kinase, partial [Polyodon spathula]|nr:KAD5 kinase [Polyodon spathula]
MACVALAVSVICTPDLVVFLACVNNRLKERLQRRAEQQGRPDDNPKATERRLANFKQNAIPLVKYFQEKGLIVTLDADRDEEEVFYDISVTVDNKLFPTKEPVADMSSGIFIGINEPGAIRASVYCRSCFLVCSLKDNALEVRVMLDLSCTFSPSELDLSLLVDSADTGSDFEEQAEDQTIYGDFNLDEELKKLKIIFVLGGPGSGKGTQCEKIEEKYGFTHLSTGDLLRSELLSDTERSRFIKDVLERGELVSMEIVLELVKEAMAASLDSTKGFLIDGFPRDVRQGEEFEMKIAEPSLVLFMDCSTETMTKRLQRRYQASPSTDSCRDTIRKRVDTFRQTIETVVTYYENRRLSHTVSSRSIPSPLCIASSTVFIPYGCMRDFATVQQVAKFKAPSV